MTTFQHTATPAMNQTTSAFLRTLAILGITVAAVGCGRTPPASFRLNMVQATKSAAPESGMEKPWAPWARQRQAQVATILEAMYGTPDAPVALAETGLDLAKLQLAAGPVRSDIVGRKNGLYREHCAHCHGISGDGMGPTAAFLNPYPRDYRPGKFKFKGTWRDGRPAREDLVRLLHQGVPGSSMPSFALLPPAQVEALVEYVRFLSMRGETELALYSYAEQELGVDDAFPETREFLVDEILTPIAEKWQGAEDAAIPVAAVPATVDFSKPGDDPANRESVARGRALFHGDGGCVKCHGVTALGDGQANDYDDWNKAIVEWGKELSGASAQSDAARAAWLHAASAVIEGDALKPRTIPPRNLRLGLYRGGRRPVDLYRRLYTGINGAPMPGVGPSGPGGKGSVAEEEIWHIVNYIRSLPYDFDGELGADRPMVAKDRF
ncbi:MAG: c-type cytochrome [Planctomycetaceae bacterium]